MQVGLTFPMADIGGDLGAVREFVQAAEQLGYSHLNILDHPLGVDPRHHPEIPTIYYSYEDVMHEPLTFMCYLAAITQRLEMVTSVLVLPQRQTALVAKQAAEVDVLSGGRIRLGVGLGWNPGEAEAMGQDWHTRARRMEEQIEVLRALWTQEVVNYKGRWHSITYAGINPLPVQRPIPIWIGAGSGNTPLPPAIALRRIARLADGCFLLVPPNGTAREAINRVKEYAREAGRDPSAIGMEGRIWFSGRGPGRVSIPRMDPDDWMKEASAWQELGVTHLSIATQAAGYTSPQQHIDAIRQFKELLHQ